MGSARVKARRVAGCGLVDEVLSATATVENLVTPKFGEGLAIMKLRDAIPGNSRCASSEHTRKSRARTAKP